jgi:hypothetical protein
MKKQGFEDFGNFFDVPTAHFFPELWKALYINTAVQH